MLKDFFKLNTPFESIDLEQFNSLVRTSKHIVNILFSPDVLTSKKINGTIFENASFSKTIIEKCTFSNCTFKDCLFIGTEFISVEFHGCEFNNCNFYKATLRDVYAKPEQFRKALLDPSHSNIAVHLYQQLRENYYKDSQREFKNEAEYFFARWNRKLQYWTAVKEGTPKYQFLPKILLSFLFDLALGYGYRLRNLLASTTLLVTSLIAINHNYAELLFVDPSHPSITKSVYFTVTTMATLGASGYSTPTETGYAVITLNVLVGISILTATVNSIFRKIIR